MRIFFALALSFLAFGAMTENYERTPLMSVIVRPADFHLKKVELNGYWDTATSTSTLLYVSKEFQEKKMFEYAINLGRHFELDIARESGQLVKIFGILNYKYCVECRYKHVITLENAKTMESMMKTLNSSNENK